METSPDSPQEKLKLRTGECVALICKDECKSFVYVKYADGFPTCICGHTQHAHRTVGVIPKGTPA
jgi:hypothetical protein